MKLRLCSVKYVGVSEELEEGYKKLFDKFKDKITNSNNGQYKEYYIEINTLEELIDIYNIVDESIIIGQDFLYNSKDKMLITIYDDYIE